MNNTNKIVGIIICLLLTTSCRKISAEFYLSAEEQAQIPFKGYETIIFLTDDKDSIVLQGGERINTRYETRSCTQCYDYIITERESIVFNSNNVRLQLAMATTKYTATSNSFSHGISIDSVGFSHGIASPLSIENLRPEEKYYDSLLVNNKMYFNIFSDTLTHIGMIEIDPYPVRMYYSTVFGVVKVDFSDGSTWKLEKIEWTE